LHFYNNTINAVTLAPEQIKTLYKEGNCKTKPINIQKVTFPTIKKALTVLKIYKTTSSR